MCGISGLLSRRPLAGTCLPDDRQRHRGPDDQGHYRDPSGRAALWFRRLAILDLSCAGHQPMSNEDGSVWLVFNGEIYNHHALRNDLERRGHVFRSRTDSEVLVHLWEEHGREMVKMLNGMFAFCIWDERRGEGFLARDHAGIKPLYMADTADGVAFASEPKVLLSLPGIDRAVDPVALQQYLTFLWVPGQRTMWRAIRKLPAGGWLSWSAERVEQGTWWDWNLADKDRATPEEWVARHRGTLLAAVDRHLESDVPLGTLLSGGLDSSAIAGAMRDLRPVERFRAYTAAIEGDAQDGLADDLPYAREVARRLDLDLHEERLRPRIAELLPLLVWHTDEPLADPAIAASYLLCRSAREDGTIVLLSGQGADELYHGYRSHRAMRLAGRAAGVPAPLMRLASALGEAVVRRTGGAAGAFPRRALKMLRFLGASSAERILQLADWGSADVRARLLAGEAALPDAAAVYGEYLDLFQRAPASSDEERWTYVLFKTFMPALNLTYGDRTSMATSVELRVPFLDRELVEEAGRMPLDVKVRDGRQKWILGELSRPWLPPSIASRPKTGFGAPLRSWLAGELHADMRRTLLGDRFLSRGYFDRGGVEELLRDLETGARDVAYIVWALYTFEYWARTFVDADGGAPLVHDA
ncbi:MAG TPA: asparagine synthase (glutamine-hydrolyzing) [Gemmatimonadaceae bacterium]|nr:asparagine synthase (glutamine-hydrolyzing) [Gemmatimonadaceae bacterium]